ncbi:MAG: hypothetical protein LBL78_06110 [Prevotellaceae bacterium]|jgi:hypothetical protein|nr:hypothetical protein [Prevotellaceae bacterium]
MKATNELKKLSLLVILLLLSAFAWCQTESDKMLYLRAGGGASMLGVMQGGGSGPSLSVGAEWVNPVRKYGEVTVGVFLSGVRGHVHNNMDKSKKKIWGMLTVPVKYKLLLGEFIYLDGGAYFDIGPGVVIGPGIGFGFDVPIVKSLYAGVYGNARVGLGLGAMVNTNAIANLSYRFKL